MSLSRIDVIEEYISSLIQNKQENEFVDFKQFYYHEDKKYDLIKDIVSFSNEVTSVDKYIVFPQITKFLFPLMWMFEKLWTNQLATRTI